MLVVYRHMQGIVAAAMDGYLIPIWCPCILAEANRVLTWQWIKRSIRSQGSEDAPLTVKPALERACSRSAKIWFGIMTEVFHVVEDRPPHEPLWTETPRDPDDVPIWNTAVRGGAHFVVTSNLADGPPPNEQGRRSFNGIECVGPDEFAAMLDWWARMSIEGTQPDDETDDSGIPPPYRALMAGLLANELGRIEAMDT